MVFRKDELEATLHQEKKLIQTGKLKDDSPLDDSEPFIRLLDACRRGDLKQCQEAITDGANINARDIFDYTPLILASLCGHYEIVRNLLEAGALCERDTFQGERCLYNALNNRIRNLLLEYDYSKSADPLQPLASHVFALLGRDHPRTSDIVVSTSDWSLRLHKFILAARSPYFRKKLDDAPSTTLWKLPSSIPPQSFEIAIKHLYLGELPRDVGGGPGSGFTEKEILEGIDKISKHLEIPRLWDGILDADDRRLARQFKSEEMEKGQAQLETWFNENVLRYKIVVDTSKASDIKWDRQNGLFADVLLRADELDESDRISSGQSTPVQNGSIPIGPLSERTPDPESRQQPKSTLFPAHRAMLLRSDYFLTMFSSEFIEAKETPYLQIVTVDCSPEVLEAVLAFLYAEKTDFPLEIALDVLVTADLLLIERLKTKAALVISTLGAGAIKTIESTDSNAPDLEDPQSADPLDPFSVLHAAWDFRVDRLEEFAARYFAYRLEHYIDLPEFADLVVESAGRIKARQETDSIVLIDEIRYFLSERFRLRFEGEGIEEMLGEEAEQGISGSGSSESATEVNGHKGVENGETQKAGNKEQPKAGYNPFLTGQSRTLDGDIAGDEFERDAYNYELLLGKIEALLANLKLDG